MLSISDSVKKAYNNYTTQRKSYIKAGNNSFLYKIWIFLPIVTMKEI